MGEVPKRGFTLSIDVPLTDPQARGLAGPPELHVRHTLERLIDERGVGICNGGGSGLGWMDVSVDVLQLEVCVGQLERILQELRINAYRITHYPGAPEQPRILVDKTGTTN